MSNLFLSFAASAARLLPLPLKRALYRSGPLARMIRKGLNRAAPEELVQVTIAAGRLAGATMILDLQQEKDYWLGTYEPELQQAIMDWVRPGMVIYDVGANIGYMTLLFAKQVGESGKVFAFEALPSNFERLKNNVKLNRFNGRVVPIAKAVADGSGGLLFLPGPSRGTGKVQGSAGREFGNANPNQAIPVKGVSLDGIVFENENPAPDVVKMDIEGGEVLAIPGMRRILREQRPVVLLELHGPESARIAWESFTEAGYKILHMSSGYPEIPGLAALSWKSYIVAKPVG